MIGYSLKSSLLFNFVITVTLKFELFCFLKFDSLVFDSLVFDSPDSIVHDCTLHTKIQHTPTHLKHVQTHMNFSRHEHGCLCEVCSP